MCITQRVEIGHSEIYYNDTADLWAKKAIHDADEIPTLAVSFSVCKKMTTKQCQSQWQTSWDRINSGRATHNLIGRKHLFPRDRCTAISYVRLLLDDSLLKAHQFRIGVESTCVCERGQRIDDTNHFLLQCTMYESLRRELKVEVQNVWEDSRKNDRLNFSVPLLLAPFSDNLLSVQDCNRILLATFRYIKKSQREL